MTLLARNAEQLFWQARYIERATSLARIIEIHSSHGRASADDLGWAWLVALYSNEEWFAEKYTERTSRNVIQFYVADLDNPASIRFCIKAARENARALRAIIPMDMWTQLNSFHNRMLALDEDDFDVVTLARTCGVIKVGCYAQLGVAESTLYRDEGERFFKLGLMIERADQTSRLLDVKFAQLATGKNGDGTIADTTFWALILRSAAAYQAFRRHEPRGADPGKVARFLLANASQPRSIAYCVDNIQSVLEDLRRVYGLRHAGRALEQVDDLINGLGTAADDPDLVGRLHDVNDWLQQQLIDLTAELSQTFFALEPPAPEKPAAQTQTQSQTLS
jgi:uncharacterized alpha-E superfamily protein